VTNRPFPIAVTADTGDGCAGGESFALMVLGDSMRPEFDDGDVVVIEPDGLAHDGSFVLAHWQGDWLLRRLARRSDGWVLHALNPDPAQPADADIALADLSAVRGVVIQKSRPGRRRATRRYVE
jgi:SOS-response transcriptional repressor LexA